MSAPRLDVWPPLPLSAWGRRRREPLPFPLDDPACRMFARARHGLWQGLKRLAIEPGDAVLTPAYHHGSEVEALGQAGLECRFYDAKETLAPDAGELEGMLGPRVRALHLIHYLGFPQDAPRWRSWCDERGLLLIEDAAQAWLASCEGQPVGSFGDLAIFSVYKTFGFPDGGALISRVPPSPPARSRRIGPLALARRHRAWVAQRWPRLAGPPPPPPSEAPYDPAEDFALGYAGAPASAPTRYLLPRLASAEAAAKRRANYRALLEELRDLVPPPFDRLPEGASPFAFPIETDDKAALLDRLASGGVLALNLWLVPHPSLPVDRFPGAASRRARAVGLPVHQELTPRHLEAIVAAVRG